MVKKPFDFKSSLSSFPSDLGGNKIVGPKRKLIGPITFSSSFLSSFFYLSLLSSIPPSFVSKQTRPKRNVDTSYFIFRSEIMHT